MSDGTLRCWGNNPYGQLGRGENSFAGDQAGEMGDSLLPIDIGTGRTISALATGLALNHACALLDDSTVKCWGGNTAGQTGLLDTVTHGVHPSEMGDGLDTLDLGTGRTAVQLSTGYYHSCALLDNGTVKCWGSNLGGRLGQGDENNRGNAPGTMGDSLTPIDLGTGRTATFIGGGGYHTCALLDNGKVKCWGPFSSS
jgi:alpha-tubulin suppressor-like RCC1 family protein